MRNKIRYALAAIAALVFWLLPFYCAAGEEEPELYARSAVLMDGDSGRILYGKNQDAELPMASTTKIMTCIVALENSDLRTVCTASQEAAGQPKVKLGMKQGERFYLEDLLYSLMLESHNDSAVCIAESLAGSVARFAGWMNEKAGQLGCTGTYYITPNGLDAQDEKGVHRTTAGELALVMRYCLTQSPKKDEFRRITGTASRTFSDCEGKRTFSCTNHNALLQMMEGALSGKTGFTGDAGYCYVGAAENEGRLYIVALLACGWPNNKGYKWVDTKKLIRYGTKQFVRKNITEKGPELLPVRVQNGRKECAAVQIHDFSDVWVLMRPQEKADAVLDWKSGIKAPVRRGEVLGTLRFLVDGVPYASFQIAAAEEVKAIDFPYCLRKIWQMFLP